MTPTRQDKKLTKTGQNRPRQDKKSQDKLSQDKDNKRHVKARHDKITNMIIDNDQTPVIIEIHGDE